MQSVFVRPLVYGILYVCVASSSSPHPARNAQFIKQCCEHGPRRDVIDNNFNAWQILNLQARLSTPELSTMSPPRSAQDRPDEVLSIRRNEEMGISSKEHKGPTNGRCFSHARCGGLGRSAYRPTMS
jgi:hypothetical protein